MEEPFELQDGDMAIEMVVCVDLNKPLVSRVKINGRLKMVEYDALPNVCFTYGLYWKGSLEIKTGGVNCVDGLHFLVLEIDGTKTNTARRAVMEGIFDRDVNEEGIEVKIMGKKEGRWLLIRPNNIGASVACKERVGGFANGSLMDWLGNVENLDNFQFQTVNVQPILNASRHMTSTS
ncbi:hypothetical protein Goklo_000939 [Gossypium klotzschianum]|uniref:Uncharacterized protein n=1 Tax=Gossypium klotzschianum TaxID=34286 RepID=A0A7J8VZT4_9ROSI|nr:hypothetical protein [Gossypium klotzschianum]